MERAYLILENGRVFSGYRFGAAKDVIGEIVFTTSMTGYLETLTDPSYYGQIVVQTFPLIGNYGVIPADFEGKTPRLSAYVVREWCDAPSNFRSQGDLDAALKQWGIPGLYGIDTRELTKIIRERGVMNAILSATADVDMDAVRSYQIRDAVASVTVEAPGEIPPKGDRLRIALWDFGAKANIRRELEKRGCEVWNVPAGATAEEILALHPDGLMLSNGPGDPAENTGIIAQLRRLEDAQIPTFGICLGHQLLALSQGARTGKLHYGHRGANQPVRDLETGRVYLTSQNHGYAVEMDSLPETAMLLYQNVNDGTCEGIRYWNMPAFSVQFHPEACAGPLDSGFLFDRFMDLIKTSKRGNR